MLSTPRNPLSVNSANLTFMIVIFVSVALVLAVLIATFKLDDDFITAFGSVIIWTTVASAALTAFLWSYFYTNGYLGYEVPPFMAALILDPWTREETVVREGFHKKKIWEEPKRQVDLRIEDAVGSGDPMTADAQVEVYKTADNYFVRTTWILGYRPNGSTDALLYSYFGTDAAVINPLLSGEMQTLLSDLIAQHDMDQLVSHRTWLNQQIEAHFVTGGVNPFETRYGIDVTSARLVNFEFSPALQQALEESAAIGIMTTSMEKLALAGIDDAVERRNTVLFMTGKLKGDVQQIKFDGSIAGLEGMHTFVVGPGMLPGTGGKGKRPTGTTKTTPTTPTP